MEEKFQSMIKKRRREDPNGYAKAARAHSLASYLAEDLRALNISPSSVDWSNVKLKQVVQANERRHDETDVLNIAIATISDILDEFVYVRTFVIADC